MRSLLAVFPHLVVAHWRDECSYFRYNIASQLTAHLHIVSWTVTESHCNDFGFCEGLFDLKGYPVTCGFAWSFTHPLHELVDPEEGIPPMPELMMAPIEDIQRIEDEDDQLLRIYVREPNDPSEPTVNVQHALSRFIDVHCPEDIREKVEAMEILVFSATQHVQRSFPLILFDDHMEGANLRMIVELVDEIKDCVTGINRTDQLVSRLRNSRNMRQFMWTITLILQYVLRLGQQSLMLQPFLAASAPFVHTFMYIQYSLGLDYADIFAEYQSSISVFFRVDPVYLGPNRSTWYIRIPMSEFQLWQVPDIPLIVTDWDMLLFDRDVVSQIADKETPRDELSAQYRLTLAHLLQNLSATLAARNDNTSLDEVEAHPDATEHIPLLFMYARHFAVDLSHLCDAFPEAVTYVHHLYSGDYEMLRVQTNTAIMDRCKHVTVPLENRLKEIETLSAIVIVLKSSTIWVDLSSQAEVMGSFLGSLYAMDPFTLSGSIYVSREVVSGRHSTEPSDGIMRWLAIVIELALNSPLFRLNTAGDCRYYVASKRGSIDDLKILRSIGRLLALYLRQGNTDNLLGNLMHSCGVGMSFIDTMFFDSVYIRKGFYDVFLEGEFERTMSHTEVPAMLQLVASRDPQNRLFPHGNIDIQ